MLAAGALCIVLAPEVSPVCVWQPTPRCLTCAALAPGHRTLCSLPAQRPLLGAFQQPMWAAFAKGRGFSRPAHAANRLEKTDSMHIRVTRQEPVGH